MNDRQSSEKLNVTARETRQAREAYDEARRVNGEQSRVAQEARSVYEDLVRERDTLRQRMKSAAIMRNKDVTEPGALVALKPIESIDVNQPFTITPSLVRYGSVQTSTELMASRVLWAQRATYEVLTREVPPEFAPYNAIIRISERGTEDQNRDYLAQIAL